MGLYVLQGFMHNNKPVYKFMDDTYGARYLFYSSQYKSWSVAKKVGGDHLDMFVSSAAFTPVLITGTWKISVGGSFKKAPKVGAECAATCKKVLIAGLV